MGHHLVKRVGGHHAAPYAGVQPVGQLVPFAHLLGVGAVDGEAAFFHGIHRVVHLLAGLGADLRTGLVAAGGHGLLHLGAHRLPGFLGDDQCAHNGCPVDLQHVGGGVVDLGGQRKVGCGRHHADHAGLDGGQHVRRFQGHRGVAQAFHDGLLLGLGAPGKELHFFVVVGAERGLFREKPHPARIAPGQHHKAFVQKLFLHARTHFFAHVVHFFPGSEQQRHGLQGRDGRLDLAQPHHRQQRPLQLADAHAPGHFGLAALAAIGVHQVLGVAPLGVAPGFANLHQLAVVQRVFGHQRANAQLPVSGLRRVVSAQRQAGQRTGRQQLAAAQRQKGVGMCHRSASEKCTDAPCTAAPMCGDV